MQRALAGGARALAGAAAYANAILLSAAVIAMVAPSAAAAPTSLQVFRQAQQAFKEGKLSTAHRLLVGVLQRQPDFQPAKMLMGRLYFRAGRSATAYKYFKTVSADLVTPDVAYDYAITMFVHKNYKRAITGFARVAPASKWANLAHFYRGFSHARLRDWDKAVTWLQRAHDLPSNLEATRREALAQARRAARAERDTSVAGVASNPYVILPTAPVPPSFVDPSFPAEPSAGPGSGSGSGAPPKKPEKAKPPATGFQNEMTPSVNVEQKATTTDYFGFQTQKATTTTSSVKLSYKGKYLGEAKPGGGQAYAALGLDLSQVASSTKGAKTKYIAYSTDPNTIIEQEQPVDSASYNNGVVLISPEASYPVVSQLDVKGGYALLETLPKFQSDAKIETKGPYGAISFNGETLDVKASGKMSDDTDAAGVLLKNTIVFGGSLNKSFETSTIDLGFTQTTTAPTVKPAITYLDPLTYFGVTQVATLALTKTFDAFSANATATYTSFVTDAAYVKSEEDSSIKVALQGTKSFEFGGQFAVTAATRQLTAYKARVDKLPDAPSATSTAPTTTDPAAAPVKVVVPADGSEMIASVSFKMAPIDWLFGQATYTYTQRTFSVSDARYEASFQQVVGETVHELTLVLGLNKTF